MEKNVAVKLEFKAKTGELKNLNKTLVQTEEDSKNAVVGLKKIKETLDGYAHPLQTIHFGFGFLKELGNLLSSPIKESIHLNAVLEQQKLQLASLVNLNHQAIDSQGNLLNATSRWSLSMKEANSIMDYMVAVHKSAIYAVDDLADMFKSFYSTASSHMSLEQAKKLFEGIVYAAQTSGASADSLKTTLDALGNGVAQTVNTFGRFIASQGLTTEAMTKAKKEGKLYAVMLEKLGGFSELAQKSAVTYEAALSSLHTSFDMLKQKALEPYFKSLTQGILDFGHYIEIHSEQILGYINILIEASKHIALFAGAFVLAKVVVYGFI